MLHYDQESSHFRATANLLLLLLPMLARASNANNQAPVTVAILTVS